MYGNIHIHKHNKTTLTMSGSGISHNTNDKSTGVHYLTQHTVSHKIHCRARRRTTQHSINNETVQAHSSSVSLRVQLNDGNVLKTKKILLMSLKTALNRTHTSLHHSRQHRFNTT